MTRMLDVELLGQLERRWRDRSPEIFDRFQPALSDSEIVATIRPLGLTVPEEVMRWFRWHDGTLPSDVIVARTFNSVAMTVQATQGQHRVDESLPSSWLAVIDNKPYVAFDCGSDPAGPVPVWHYDYDTDFPTRPAFASIGDMVALWIEMIDDGHLVWEPDRGGWEISADAPVDVMRRASQVPIS